MSACQHNSLYYERGVVWCAGCGITTWPPGRPAVLAGDLVFYQSPNHIHVGLPPPPKPNEVVAVKRALHRKGSKARLRLIQGGKA